MHVSSNVIADWANMIRNLDGKSALDGMVDYLEMYGEDNETFDSDNPNDVINHYLD